MKRFMINQSIGLSYRLPVGLGMSVQSLLLFVKQEVVFKWADTAVCFLIGLIFNKFVEIKFCFFSYKIKESDIPTFAELPEMLN